MLVARHIKLVVPGVRARDLSSPGNKLRAYDIIKHSIEMEAYLLENSLTWTQKKKLTKFRIGDHKLRVEIGRHCKPNLPPDKRTCLVCQTNVTEDEIHFSIDCIEYKHLRDKYCIIKDCNTSHVLQFRHIIYGR